jgi:hypothetical protein
MRVVKVRELAVNIQEKLVSNVITSAEFAVEMIESPAKVMFRAPA